jgi:hypothetical protein
MLDIRQTNDIRIVRNKIIVLIVGTVIIFGGLSLFVYVNRSIL